MGAGVTLLLCALLAMALVTALLAWRAQHAVAMVERQGLVSEQLRGLNQLMIALLNAETGQRGYLLTQRDAYLEPHAEAMGELDLRLDELARMLSTASQQQRLVRVLGLVRDKREELQRSIDLVRAGRHEQALALVLSDQGKREMDSLRQELGSLVADLRAERAGLATALGSETGTTRLMLLLALSLLAIFSTLALWQVLRGGARLREAEGRLRRIANHVPLLITQFDRQQRIIFANEQVRRLYGIDPSEVLGKTVADVRGADAGQHLQPFIDQVMTGEAVRFESSSVIQGRQHHFEQHYVPDLDAEGRPRGFFSVTLDITERKEAAARASASERRLAVIADALPVLIAYLDQDLRLHYANETFHRWLGMEASAMLGLPLAEVLGPALYGQREPCLRAALAGERVQVELSSDMQGRLLHLQNDYIPDQRADGQVVGIFVLSTDVTTLKQAQAQLAEMARTDALTGLPNRRELDQRLALALVRAQREGWKLALLFLDLDRFKAINDEQGHAVGDAVLQAFAQRLQASVRATDSVARLAGDEFVVLVEGLNEAADAIAVAEKVLQAMDEPMLLDGLALQVGTSIGIALHEGRAGLDAAQLLAQADAALYEAKRAGRQRYALYPASADGTGAYSTLKSK
ncbi:diguanylate cyclase [Pelomonas sp. V22]|uniref:diguanylate cyclase domain-containing protein n=1 Tax=Pelomonas sp. V22 TaxID=2822139 RepID=UPI0024A7AF48|nr:diguanylate cyclase [Pelomonas sp. V22]MDI4634287.1 diguanylate cyclase [Pelomonas sp. V22]